MVKKGFTLSEILITLTVIGIVAAISLPSLMQNINERTWDAKRKALLSRMSAAIGQIEEINRFGKYETKTTTNSDNTTTTEQIDTMAESFVVEGLSKVYKIKNVCATSDFTKCGFPKTVTSMYGYDITPGATGFSRKAAAFQTTNGESLVTYYNPDCRPSYITETTRYPKETICANFIYDLNGADEPNEMGKDMGVMSVVYDTNQEPEVVAPNLYYKSLGNAPSYAEDGNDAASKCKKEDPKLRLQSLNEAISSSFNYSYLSIGGGITGTMITPGKTGTVWYVGTGTASQKNKTESLTVLCVKD